MATLRLCGSVAALAATHQLATGVRGVRGHSERAIDPSVDSEMRFYAAWYAMAGALMHAAARNRDLDRSLWPAFELGWALAATSRLMSAKAVGRPHALFVGLAAAEAAVALTLLTHPPQSVVPTGLEPVTSSL